MTKAKAKEGREFVSRNGRAQDAITKLFKAVYAEGGFDEDVLCLAEDPEKCRQVAALLVKHKERSTVVDLDAPPFVPDGWSVRQKDQLPGRARGTIDLATAKLGLSLADAQKNGCAVIGTDLRKALAAELVLNANVLDFLLKPENQRLIPEAWKSEHVFFWGTVYCTSEGYLLVRRLCWTNGQLIGAQDVSVHGWYWSDYRLDHRWNFLNPAAVIAG